MLIGVSCISLEKVDVALGRYIRIPDDWKVVLYTSDVRLVLGVPYLTIKSLLNINIYVLG